MGQGSVWTFYTFIKNGKPLNLRVTKMICSTKWISPFHIINTFRSIFDPRKKLFCSRIQFKNMCYYYFLTPLNEDILNCIRREILRRWCRQDADKSLRDILSFPFPMVTWKIIGHHISAENKLTTHPKYIGDVFGTLMLDL